MSSTKFLKQLHANMLKLINELPCKSCLVLPKCMNRDNVECPILKTTYTYLNEYIGPTPKKSDTYTQLLMNEITKCFKKQLMWITCPPDSDILVLNFTTAQKGNDRYSSNPRLRGW